MPAIHRMAGKDQADTLKLLRPDTDMLMDLSEPAKGEPYRGIVWFNTRDDSYAIAEHNLGVDYRKSWKNT